MDQSIFKAYDVRGKYPDQINSEIAFAVAQGFADLIKPKEVVIGHDVRLHSEELKKAMIDGLVDAGINVTDIGLITTEMLYFATGYYGFDGGIAVTASHDITVFHGAKFVRRDARPISGDSGLSDIKKFVVEGKKISSSSKGEINAKNILDDYCKYLLGWIDQENIKPFKILADPNFGYQGAVLDRLIEHGSLPLKIIKVNYKPDGSFPKGRPDPQTPENTNEFEKETLKAKVDFGVTWDADGDRVYFALPSGRFINSYYTNTLFIKLMLKKYPGSNIVYDPRNIGAIVDTIKENGGNPILSKVGHAFIKEKMRKEDAVFAGEFSGHTYYKDFWYADSGMIPFLQIIDLLSKSNQSIDNLLNPIMSKYFVSGEINYKTENAKEILRLAEDKYSDGQIDKTDGVSCLFPDWRFNLRTSNTGESFIRLNIESENKELLEEKVKELTEFVEENK